MRINMNLQLHALTDAELENLYIEVVQQRRNRVIAALDNNDFPAPVLTGNKTHDIKTYYKEREVTLVQAKWIVEHAIKLQDAFHSQENNA